MEERLLDTVNTGVVILDRKFRISEWNHWMSVHSGMSREDVVDRNIFTLFPELNSQSILRGCKSVLTFGTTLYFSQKLHNYLFPCPVTGSLASKFEYMQQRCTMAALRDAEGNTNGILVTVEDVTESVALEQHLRELNLMDALTGVFNRRFLDQRLAEELLRCRRYERRMGLLMIDLDRFKKLNDTHGHICGDEVLRQVAKRITASVRGSDIVTRFGGEEFALILPDTGEEGAMLVAERVRTSIEAESFEWKGRRIAVTVSIGVAIADADTPESESALEASDAALYLAKKRGRNRTEKG